MTLKQNFLISLIILPLTIHSSMDRRSLATSATVGAIAGPSLFYLGTEIHKFEAQLPQPQEIENTSLQEIDNFKNLLQKQIAELTILQESLSPYRYPLAITKGVLICILAILLKKFEKIPHIIDITGFIATAYIGMTPFLGDLVIKEKLEILNNLLNLCQQRYSSESPEKEIQQLVTTAN